MKRLNHLYMGFFDVYMELKTLHSKFFNSVNKVNGLVSDRESVR
ncbi:MAG: hypothetical protein N3A01_01305 [Bacteroidales bacterium]|nr:hypothetical protein [Bacteroidales bacterium]